MRRPATFAALAALAIPSIPTPAHAQDRLAEVDRIFAAITPETPGCGVGVSQRGTVLVNKAYGLADVERRRPLGPTSRFDIGSTQKQFTAAAVLLLVEEGRLALTDDVRKHLPDLPDYGQRVTIDHLLSHTGGIRDWTGLLPMAPEGTDVLALVQRQRGLNFAPGDAWAYSSSGYELAKAIVAKVGGTSFAEFTRRRLFAPLGMTSTAYVPDILQAGPDAALGYQKDGAGWRPYMRLGANRGGGAIATTVGDILTWNDALASGKLGPFVTARLHEPARLNNGRTLTYARGLFVETNRGRRMAWHSGGAAGYSTLMSRFPEHGLSVAVTCNFDPVSATALAARVADVFLPPVDSAALRGGPVAATGVDVAPHAGLYLDERTGEPMRLGVADGRLVVANGPALVPVSATSFRPARPELFFRSQDDFTLSVPDADHVEIRSMEGQVTRYRRARAWTPTAADLQAVAGRYESTELGAVFEIVPGDGALTMRMVGAPQRAIALAPVERDTYMQRMMIVRFRRDASGKVVGLEYGNPLVRQLAFTRLGELAGAQAPSLPVSKEAPAGTAAAAPAAAPRLDGLAGEYELAPGRTLAVTVEGGRLHGQPPGGTKRALTHVSGTTFAAEGAPVTLTFTVGADGRATALVMRQNGGERTAPRVR